MHITIRCFATLSRFTPPDAEAFAVTPGETAGQLAQRLGIPLAELKLVFINGAHVELTAQLADGDRVGLFPAVGGG
ncbi:MAG: molybdopterin synthase sulfur carrier subunit [Desulfovibrionales bacterium GWA2_65_9]|nr:MAG: molybdopterin synthase sulfur carrier subunit [Desulfovibrionales bacterium GWA2_65_9]